MHNELILIDVSPFVHAGSINKHARLERLVQEDLSWKTQVTPAGGASLIFNVLYETVGKFDIIACCDRNPTVKKDMIPGYKSTREHKPVIEINKQVAEYILEDCGISVLAADGYEADDLIYTCVKKLYNMYDHIYIYTSDSDLYFLVDDKVSIKPSSSRAKEITKENFSSVKIHGSTWRYNALTVNKIIFGDASDEIPPLPADVRAIAQKIYFDDEMSDAVCRYGDKEFVKAMAIGQPLILKQIENVFPIYLDEYPIMPQEPNIQRIRGWGDAIHNKLFRGKAPASFNVDEETEKIQNLGMYLDDVI